MKKVAKLVSISMMTRVIVDENATIAEILLESRQNFIEKVRDELSEHLEEIFDDTEMPYDDFDKDMDKTVGTEYIPTEEFGGGSLQGYFTTSYKKLVKLFGEPNSEGDDYKVSTEWTLKSPKGKIVCLYDYKQTKMYDSDGLTIENFRKLKSYDWHIGGNSTEDADELVAYLKSKGL
jgi:hypothetical protein